MFPFGITGNIVLFIPLVGVVMKGSGSSSITNNMVMLSFEDSPTAFKPGMMYEGKVIMI